MYNLVLMKNDRSVMKISSSGSYSISLWDLLLFWNHINYLTILAQHLTALRTNQERQGGVTVYIEGIFFKFVEMRFNLLL